MTRVVGVDGAPGGWIAVAMQDGQVADAAFHATFASVLEVEATTRVVAVDMPIGLPESPPWRRFADHAAKAFIGPLASSVFVVAPQVVVDANSYAEAVQRCHELGIGGISQQAWALRHKIAEVAACLPDPRVYEVHPEVSFAAMNGAFLGHGKRTWNGHQERSRILASAGISMPDDLGDLRRAGLDDVLDATAAAWSANRISQGAAKWLPADARGNPRIWY